MYQGGKDVTSPNYNTLERDQNTVPMTFAMEKLWHLKVEEIEKRIERKRGNPMEQFRTHSNFCIVIQWTIKRVVTYDRVEERPCINIR
jgi:hypothetical protein